MGFSKTLLNQQTIMVTGAGKGIGRECTELLIHYGAYVIAVEREESDLHSLQAKYGSRIQAWTTDIQSTDFLEKVRNLEKLDGLINNVGVNRVANMTEQPDADLDLIVDINLKSLYRTSKAALIPMQRSDRGSIVNMSSQMGYVGSPGRTLYCMSKHGVEGLTKAMAVELATKNIRVNTVSPTFVLTPMTKPMFDDPKFKSFVMDMIPMNKLATTTDVANACIFLLSDLSAMVTGTTIKVDGGWTAQ